MANTLNKIEVVTDFKHLQIREITAEGGYHRRVLTPDADVSAEDPLIQEHTETLWTDEVKEKWSESQAEQEAQLEALRNPG